MHVVTPAKDHCMTIVFLHGRGSDGLTFANEIFESQSEGNKTLAQLLPTARWVFPTAPSTQSEMFKCHMRQWFDMDSTSAPEKLTSIQHDALEANGRRLMKILEEEVELVGADKVVLAGISQGAALCLYLALQHPLPAAGLIALSSWLPTIGAAQPHMHNESLFARQKRREPISESTHTSSAKTLPVFVGHCMDDDVIAVSKGSVLANTLEVLGFPVEWHEYANGGHWLNEPQGVDDLYRFICDVVKTEMSWKWYELPYL